MILIYITLAVMVLLLLGVLYQSIATKNDLHRCPPPGQFINIDERKLHYITYGSEHGPTVIFDHGCGIGSSSLIWKLVSDQVSKFAKVVIYDRAGYGWSDSGQYPRTNESAVNDLRILIEKTNIHGPILLVGHSYGGVNVRLFAKKYNGLAMGIVLVDATHEDELTSRFPEKYVKGQLMGRKAFKMIQYLCYFGILRLLGKIHAFKQLEIIQKCLPLSIQPSFQSILYLNKTAKTVASEFSHLDLGYHQVRGQILENVPLIVIKSGIVENLTGFSEVEATKVKTELHNVAVEMSGLSNKGELWIAEKSGHNIHIEYPEMIIKAIHELCK